MVGRVIGVVAAVALLGAFLAVPATALAENVLVNSSFEATVDWGEGPKPEGWGVWGMIWSIDAGDPNATLPPHDGERMAMTMGPWWCPWCNSGFVQDHPAGGGELWEISAWSYAPSAFPMAGTQNFIVMKIEFWDHFDPHPEWGEQPLAQPEVTIADGNTTMDEWHYNALTFAAPAGTVMARAAFVWLQPNWEEGAAIVDEASFGPLLDLDAKPFGCPNSFNPGSEGVIPIALLSASESLDITTVDAASLSLARADGLGGSVTPVHTAVEDKGTPISGEWCLCHEAGPDGLMDLVAHFDSVEVSDALGLGGFDPGAWVELNLSGNLLDGTAFGANDCVRLVPPGAAPAALHVRSNTPNAWIDVYPPDGTLDGGGFGSFQRSYFETAVVNVEATPVVDGRVFVRLVVDGVPQPVGVRSLTLTMGSSPKVVTAVYARVNKLEPNAGNLSRTGLRR